MSHGLFHLFNPKSWENTRFLTCTACKQMCVNVRLYYSLEYRRCLLSAVCSPAERSNIKSFDIILCLFFVVAVAAFRSGRMSSWRGIPRSLMASLRSRCRRMPSGCPMLSSVNCTTANGCCNYSCRYFVIQGQRDGCLQVACSVRDNTWRCVQPI